MANIIPTIGRIVLYCVASHDAENINRRRKHASEQMDYHRWKKNGTMVHVGNSVSVGQIVPAMVVAVWGNEPTSAVNLKLMLDGSDDYWVTSTSAGDPTQQGRYHWMAYQMGQAAKTEAAEAKVSERAG